MPRARVSASKLLFTAQAVEDGRRAVREYHWHVVYVLEFSHDDAAAGDAGPEGEDATGGEGAAAGTPLASHWHFQVDHWQLLGTHSECSQRDTQDSRADLPPPTLAREASVPLRCRPLARG